MTEAVRIGCIGVAGYAGNLLLGLHQSVGPERARIAAVDVSRSTPSDALAEVLDAHQARRVQGVNELLGSDDLDAVIVATSIDSHLAYTTQALEAGLAVHCEKPITATIQDAMRMIEARDRCDGCVHVGYQDTYSPSVQWAKRQLVDGAIGRIERVTVRGQWPRPGSYYRRNDWAGRIRRDTGAWILDSPAHNALAHQVNLALYLSGQAADDSNRATAVEAELYRAREIENYDTCAIRAATAAGCDLLVLLSHASADYIDPVVELTGSDGVMRRFHPDRCELWRDGELLETMRDGPVKARHAMFESLVDRVNGAIARARCEIENAMEVTRLINGASAATPVRRVDPSHVKRLPTGKAEDDAVAAIDALSEVFERCRERFALPSELGDVAWASKPGKLDMSGFDQFDGPAEA